MGRLANSGALTENIYYILLRLHSPAHGSIGHGRRGTLVLGAMIAFGDDIVTQPLADMAGVGHGLDAAGVDGTQLLDDAEDVVELGQHVGALRIIQPDAGEFAET